MGLRMDRTVCTHGHGDGFFGLCMIHACVYSLCNLTLSTLKLFCIADKCIGNKLPNVTGEQSPAAPSSDSHAKVAKKPHKPGQRQRARVARKHQSVDDVVLVSKSSVSTPG